MIPAAGHLMVHAAGKEAVPRDRAQNGRCSVPGGTVRKGCGRTDGFVQQGRKDVLFPCSARETYEGDARPRKRKKAETGMRSTRSCRIKKAFIPAGDGQDAGIKAAFLSEQTGTPCSEILPGTYRAGWKSPAAASPDGFPGKSAQGMKGGRRFRRTPEKHPCHPSLSRHLRTPASRRLSFAPW